MLTMSQLTDLAETTRDTINKWAEYGLLSQPMPKTQPGVTRYFPRLNALEIILRAAAMRCGMSSGEATTTVAKWMDFEDRGLLPQFWAFNPTKGFVADDGPTGFGLVDADMGVMTLMEINADDIGGGYPDGPRTEHKPASMMVVVNLSELVRRLDNALKQSSK